MVTAQCAEQANQNRLKWPLAVRHAPQEQSNCQLACAPKHANMRAGSQYFSCRYHSIPIRVAPLVRHDQQAWQHPKFIFGTQQDGLPGVHVSREVLREERCQEGREQVIDALHIPAGRVPASQTRLSQLSTCLPV